MIGSRVRLVAVVLALAGAGGCSDDDGGSPIDAAPADAAPEPLFPADYASTWTKVRDCRSSSSHDFHLIVIWADPDAAGPYLDRDADFPVGSVVLKEEYDIGDTECTGDIVQWSLMKRLEAGSAPEAQLDWLWQKVDENRQVLTQNESRCYACHLDCDGDPGDSYENTCAEP
ncbi:MAG TPA: cytochrome P460 family protein [Kofleriaceae bacterium]